MSRYSFNLSQVNQERKRLGRPPLSDQQARKIAANTDLNTDLGLALLAATVITGSSSTESYADTPSFVAGGGDTGGGGASGGDGGGGGGGSD